MFLCLTWKININLLTFYIVMMLQLIESLKLIVEHVGSKPYPSLSVMMAGELFDQGVFNLELKSKYCHL